MRTAVLVIGVAIVAVIAVNVGTEWGITARPVPTLQPTCETITRYEDGTARCTYIMPSDNVDAFAGTPVISEEPDLFIIGTADKQETITGQALQPTRKVQ